MQQIIEKNINLVSYGIHTHDFLIVSLQYKPLIRSSQNIFVSRDWKF